MTDGPGLAECTQGHRQGPKTELKPNLVFGGGVWFVILFSFLFFFFNVSKKIGRGKTEEKYQT